MTTMRSVALSPQAREAALDAMAATELDVLVVGGGVVGAGAALDAATRGLRSGWSRRATSPRGTSSRSSKLIHGGLRYLEMLDFGLVPRRCGSAGCCIQRLAPHLVRPVPFLYPLQHRGWERLYAGSGVALYDTLALLSGRGRGRAAPPAPDPARRRADRPVAAQGRAGRRDAVLRRARSTTPGTPCSWPARPRAYGAHVASRARVVGLLREGERVTGAGCTTWSPAATFEVRARQVDQRDRGVDRRDPGAGRRARAVPGAGLQGHPPGRAAGPDPVGDTGLILRTEKSVLFVIPWGRHWIIGTTDTDWELDKAHPAASARRHRLPARARQRGAGARR